MVAGDAVCNKKKRLKLRLTKISYAIYQARNVTWSILVCH